MGAAEESADYARRDVAGRPRLRVADWGKRAADSITRFAGAETGSLIWSRHPDRTWLLGELTGEWRPDYSPEAKAVDAHQVRGVLWAPRRLQSEEGPASVIRPASSGPFPASR